MAVDPMAFRLTASSLDDDRFNTRRRLLDCCNIPLLEIGLCFFIWPSSPLLAIMAPTRAVMAFSGPDVDRPTLLAGEGDAFLLDGEVKTGLDKARPKPRFGGGGG